MPGSIEPYSLVKYCKITARAPSYYWTIILIDGQAKYRSQYLGCLPIGWWTVSLQANDIALELKLTHKTTKWPMITGV